MKAVQKEVKGDIMYRKIYNKNKKRFVSLPSFLYFLCATYLMTSSNILYTYNVHITQ